MAKYELQLAIPDIHRPLVASILHESDMHKHEDKEAFVRNFCKYCEEMDVESEFVIMDTETNTVVGGLMVIGTRSFHRYGVGAAIQIVSNIQSKITNGNILKQVIDFMFINSDIKWAVTYKHLANGDVLEVYRSNNKHKEVN